MRPFENDIEEAKKVLTKGGTLLYPTDTIWGLGCDATSEKAVEAVTEIKKRPEDKSYIVLMTDTQMLRKYLTNPYPNLDTLVSEQKGATTIIYESIVGIAKNALAADGSLGIRIPKDEFCLALLNSFGKPILSTSANESGQPSPKFYKQIQDEIRSGVDYTVKWRQDDETEKEPSSIIKLNEDGSILKIR
jgi:L-threonylcarbamoyladenylate synthase